MNSVKLQGTKFIYKKQLCIYELITDYQKEKSRKQLNLQLHKKNKIPRQIFNKGGDVIEMVPVRWAS